MTTSLAPESLLADELVRDFSFIGLFNGAPDLAERRESPSPAPTGSALSMRSTTSCSVGPGLPGGYRRQVAVR